MTLTELIRECGELGRAGETGQRVLGDWPLFINRAQRQIAQRRNWTFMHAVQPFSILGTTIPITSNTAAAASVVTTSSAHGGTTGDIPTISGNTGSVPSINGVRPITVLTNTTFSVPVTTTTGGTGGSVAFRGVSLGSTFKSLASERSPVAYQSSAGDIPVPVRITSRAESNRGGGVATSPLPGSVAPVSTLILEANGPGGQWALYLPDWCATAAMTLQVSGYFFPADLALGSDHNALTDHGDLCEALVSLAKARAYFAEESDSPKGMAAMALYEQAYRHAAYTDAHQQFAGRQLQY